MDLGPLLEDEIMGYRVAVVGATGAVGREMLQTLAERNFPADTIYALASTKSVGKEVSYGDEQILKIEALLTQKVTFYQIGYMGISEN